MKKSKSMKAKIITVWITSWALWEGHGIFKMKGKQYAEYPHMVEIVFNEYGTGSNLKHCIYEGDWHTTRKAAVERAKQMRDERITKLAEELKKLKKLHFK